MGQSDGKLRFTYRYVIDTEVEFTIHAFSRSEADVILNESLYRLRQDRFLVPDMSLLKDEDGQMLIQTMSLKNVNPPIYEESREGKAPRLVKEPEFIGVWDDANPKNLVYRLNTEIGTVFPVDDSWVGLVVTDGVPVHDLFGNLQDARQWVEERCQINSGIPV